MYISPYCWLVHVPPIFMKFGIRGQHTDVITCVKFLVDLVQGLRSSDTPKLPFPIDLLRRPYNSVALPCDTVTNMANGDSVRNCVYICCCVENICGFCLQMSLNEDKENLMKKPSRIPARSAAKVTKSLSDIATSRVLLSANKPVTRSSSNSSLDK